MRGLLILLAFSTVALVQGDQHWSKITPLDINAFGFKDVVPGNSRIIGGDEATPHSFPHQVGIYCNHGFSETFCGGSILSSKFILTAAHCVDAIYSAKVIVGAHNIMELETTQQRIVATKFHVHADWDLESVRNDIAIIELPEEIQFNENIQPIRLPRYSETDSVLNGKEVTVSGWGLESDDANDISPVLRCLNTKIMNHFICKIAFFFTPGPNTICTGGWKRIGTCHADSGGPLIGKEADGRNTQLGIVSFGFKLTCELGWPSVYTKVSSYLSWIHEITNLPIRD